MPENTQITTFDLSSADARRSIPQLVEGFFERGDAASAVILLMRILKSPQLELIRTELATVFPKLVLLSIPLLPKEELPVLVAQYLAPLLDLDTNGFLGRLALAFEGTSLASRDQQKRFVLERCAEQAAPLTTAALIASDSQTRQPSIGNWVADYLASRAVAAAPDAYVRLKPNAAGFSASDRGRIAGLVALVQLLTTPSTKLEGLEEEIPVRRTGGRLGVLERGELRPVATAAPVARPASPPPAPPAPAAPPRVSAPPATPTTIPLPSVPAPAKPVAKFYFHPEDEAEAQRHAERLAGMDLAPSSTDVADLVVDGLMVQHGLQFPDELLHKRFRTASVAHLKGIRTARDTQDILTRDRKIGGLGLPVEQAQAILASLDRVAGQMHETGGLERLKTEHEEQRAATPGSIPEVFRPVAPQPARSTEPEKRSPAPVAFQPTPRPATPSPPPPIAQNAPTFIPAPGQSSAATARPVFEAKRLDVSPTPVYRPRPPGSEKPKLEDIRTTRPVRRTVGPVDELHALTLAELRRFGDDTASAIRKLQEKFIALARESYALRVQGIIGWRSSPLYQSYLELGNDSMNSRRPIEQIIASRQQGGAETMTADEFNAIADLNRGLRL